MSASLRRFGLFGLGLLACAVCGCIDERQTGTEIVWKFSWWVPSLVLLAGAVLVPVGVWLRQSTGYGWVLIIAGPILLVGVGPGLFGDRVTLDEQHFTLKTGLWFSRTAFDVRFDDVQRIDITSQTRRTRRGGKRTSYYLDCYKTSGGMDHVPVGTLMDEAAASILALAHERGIPINDRTE